MIIGVSYAVIGHENRAGNASRRTFACRQPCGGRGCCGRLGIKSMFSNNGKLMTVRLI